jgi:pimeloyl-ACP methyl ester carboxylesterase
MRTIAGSVSRRVALRGIDFHYLEWGDTALPTGVLLHGRSGHAHIWDHMAPTLAERYHLIALDQRGHGDTAHAETYATRDFVDDLEALRQHWRIETFVLMGLSMGGHNAMAYASQHSQRVERLIIIDIPPAFDLDRAPDRSESEATARDGHTVFASFDEAMESARPGNPHAPEENLRCRMVWNMREVPGGMIFKYDPKVLATWQPDDLWSAAQRLTMPSLLVRAGLTNTLPRSAADRMVAEFPRLELVEIEGSGHSVPTDRPEKLTPILLDWLSR